MVILGLLVTLAVASALRMTALGYSPPGTTDDESVEIWNAYCLLKTGHGFRGESWPIFYSRCMGDNHPVLFMYLLTPFQAVFGLSVWSARFGTAVMGVISVLLMYVIGSRLFNSRLLGLVAAWLLAVNPWAIRESRYAFMATPFFIFLPIALLMLANLPFQNGRNRPPRPVLAGIAGAVTGIVCYGYASFRLFLPVFLTAAVLVTWRGWWNQLRTRKGALTLAAAALGVALTFGPLVWRHLKDPEIAKRGKGLSTWKAEDRFWTNLGRALARYPAHYGLGFLFMYGEDEKSWCRKIPDMGQFDWYMLPLMVAGLGTILWKARRSHAARFLLVWLILYPISDLTYVHLGVHVYRSVPGLPCLVLLAAVGAATIGGWLWSRSRKIFTAAACAMVLAMGVCHAYFLRKFTVEFNRQAEYVHGFQGELVEAFRWLKPRFKGADAILFWPHHWGQPYVMSLVTLGYDPRRWFEDEPEFLVDYGGGDLDVCRRYGKVFFMYDEYWIKALQAYQSIHGHVYLVMPPNSVQGLVPVHRIDCGAPLWVLWIYEVQY